MQARQAARASALQELQFEVSLRRSSLEEARSNYQTRRELGADDREYVYLAGEVGTQSRFALPFERKASLADALYDAGGVASSTGDVASVCSARIV